MGFFLRWVQKILCAFSLFGSDSIPSPVPEKIRIEMVIEMQMEILNGGES